MVTYKDKKYQAIISDFDGTLAGKEKVVSEPVQEAIKKLKDQGVVFIIASGRNFAGTVETACLEMELTSPQIVCGGGEIIEPKTRKVISAEYITDTDLRELYELLKTKKVDFWIEKDFEIYTWGKETHDSLGPSVYKDLADIELTKIPKVGIFPVSDHKLGEELEEELTAKFKNLHITKSFSPVARSWDITASMGNKQEAVLKISHLLNIPIEEIIGIGDGYNDFPLLEACGYKVAMGNANDALKKIADEVVPSYQEDGVASFINTLLKG